VVIAENGAGSLPAPDPALRCERFVLSERQVRRYFQEARQVPRGAGHATLDWSPCHAAGSLVFKDGRSARWSISAYRVGSLIPEGQAELVLYCPSCDWRPFARSN
jgi:hypothetical protein